MKAKEIYSQIYRMTDGLTPLKIDCGKLCGEACCQDNEFGDAGMYLYYGEEIMHKGSDFLTIEDSSFIYGEDDRAAKICFCKGKCIRAMRPLSCRIFPLIPYKKPGIALQMIIDPRAKAMCPLAKTMSVDELDEKFVETVAYIFKVLVKNKHIRDFVIEQSYLLDEIDAFYK